MSGHVLGRCSCCGTPADTAPGGLCATLDCPTCGDSCLGRVGPRPASVPALLVRPAVPNPSQP